MLSRTRIKFIGAGVSAAVLFAGHSVLPAHADSPTGLATLVAGAEASNAVSVATDPLTWADPNVTCGPIVNGHPISNGIDEGVAQVSAEEWAEADLNCFSFTNSNYTVTATLAILDYDDTTQSWVPVCSYTAPAVTATAGLNTQHFILECFDRVNVPTAPHVHEAQLTWVNSIVGTSPGIATSTTWMITY